MRILVRDRHTHRYYAGPHDWTAAHGHAWNFESVEAATRLCSQTSLAAAEVLLVSDIVEGSAPIPVPPLESPYLRAVGLAEMRVR